MLNVAYSACIDETGVCALRTPFDEKLRLAIRAIPGRFWDAEHRIWRIHLGPDRAESVARLLASFPKIRPDPAMAEALDAYRRLRTVARPGIESVMAVDDFCLSLCDDWEHPILSELAEVPGVLTHPEIGRLSVPITSENQRFLRRTIARHHVRIHARTRERLETPTARRPSPEAASPVHRPAPWRGWAGTAAIDGRPFFVFSTLSGTAPRELRTDPDVRRTSNVWTVPMDGRHRELVASLLARNPQMLVDRRAKRCLEHLDPAVPDDPPPPALLTVSGEDADLEFHIEALWDSEALDDTARLPESIRSTALTRHGEHGGEAVLPADAATVTSVADIVATYGVGVDEAASRLLDELLEAHTRGEQLVRLSEARDAQFEPPRGLTGELMPFQAAGVSYALQQRRVFIADEQGLGKTVQALAAVEAADAYPAVVVCPASLKLNWLREATRWLPARTTHVVAGRRAALPDSEIVIVNYDVLHAHVDALAAITPGALVFDESHYCKNPKARRTKALIDLSERLPEDTFRLALTGTPLVNRPKELVPQLRALGRLSDFGSGASFERRFRGAEARQRLHWHLRSTCYVRRRKEDVLSQLPPKRRITVPVPLTNDVEYRRLEDDLIAWLRDAVPDPAQLARRIDNALRAQALVKLNALRHVAAEGKLKAATEWIDSFLASGERLVVFAHHRDIQAALLEAFPHAARIVGADSVAQRDANVERFQRPGGPPLCVCSLEAASHGFTLTAAASVAFLELGWTPAKHDQAEDRIHRIGQARNVTAWYLLAADTIDERIAALIDHKRALVGSVTDGSVGAEAAVVDRLLRDLADHGGPSRVRAA